MKKSYQDWCVDTLFTFFQSYKQYRGHYQDQGYIYVIKAIINHYASMYYCGEQQKLMGNGNKQHINFWKDHLNNHNRERFFAPLLMSEEASNKIRSCTSTKELKKFLRFEHITPIGWIYQRLYELNDRKNGGLTKENIRAELKHNKLILLTKREVRCYLDGAKQGFTNKDVELLREHFPEFAQKHANELDQLIKGNRSSKDSGFGLLRIEKLYNNGVRFCYANEKECSPSKWIKYLEDTDFTIK